MTTLLRPVAPDAATLPVWVTSRAMLRSAVGASVDVTENRAGALSAVAAPAAMVISGTSWLVIFTCCGLPAGIVPPPDPLTDGADWPLP